MSTFIGLTEYRTEEEKEFSNSKNIFRTKQNDFSKIPVCKEIIVKVS